MKRKERTVCLVNAYFIVSILILLYSCSTSSKEPDLDKNSIPVSISFNSNLNEKYYYLSEFTDSIEYLKLETNDSCFLKKINKLYTLNNEIYISDGNRLFVFNRQNGKFLRKIGNIGKGPGEYYEVEDFVIFPDQNKVIISDLKSGQMHVFTTQGRFVERIRLSHAPFKVNKIEGKFVGLYSYPDFIFNKMHSLYFSDLSFKNNIVLIDRSYTGIKESMYNKIPSTSRSVLEYYNDTLTYWEFENDTIYKIVNSSSYKAAYYLNFPDKGNGNFMKFSYLIESKKYIFFLQGVNMLRQNIVHCIFNKFSGELNSVKFNFKNKKMQLKAGIINDIDNGWPFLPIGQTNDNELFCYFFKHELEMYLKENNVSVNKIPDYVKKSKFIDNPIIMLIKLKQ